MRAVVAWIMRRRAATTRSASSFCDKPDCSSGSRTYFMNSSTAPWATPSHASSLVRPQQVHGDAGPLGQPLHPIVHSILPEIDPSSKRYTVLLKLSRLLCNAEWIPVVRRDFSAERGRTVAVAVLFPGQGTQ